LGQAWRGACDVQLDDGDAHVRPAWARTDGGSHARGVDGARIAVVGSFTVDPGERVASPAVDADGALHEAPPAAAWEGGAMHVGRLHFRLAARQRAAALARFDASACYAGLRALAHGLAGQRWMVVSGLVEPLVNGRFSRAHSDIDIAVPVDSLRSMAEAACAHGYVLTMRVLRTHLTARADLEAHLVVAPWMLDVRCRHLRLWRCTSRGALDESTFPAYVDVFPYALAGDEMHILDSGQRLPLRAPLWRDVPLPDGARIPVEDPSYLDALKVARRNARMRETARRASGSAAASPLEP
jgi:hypothetical protein